MRIRQRLVSLLLAGALLLPGLPAARALPAGTETGSVSATLRIDYPQSLEALRDREELSQALGSGNRRDLSRYDLSGDGVIDLYDLAYLSRNLRTCIHNRGMPDGRGFFSSGKEIFRSHTRPCLKIGGMPDWGRFFCQARRFDAGILTDFKSNQRGPGGKRCPKTAF